MFVSIFLFLFCSQRVPPLCELLPVLLGLPIKKNVGNSLTFMHFLLTLSGLIK